MSGGPFSHNSRDTPPEWLNALVTICWRLIVLFSRMLDRRDKRRERKQTYGDGPGPGGLVQ